VQLGVPEDTQRFVAELEPDCLALILDANGNHVIQRCLQKFGAAHTGPIYNVVLANCLHVAQHRHGCCVLQRCIDYATPDKRQELALAVAEHGLSLSQNAYGNYVVQVWPFPCRHHSAVLSSRVTIAIKSFTFVVITTCSTP
jgi:hypothetical protein